jgi:hypothetical protein
MVVGCCRRATVRFALHVIKGIEVVCREELEVSAKVVAEKEWECSLFMLGAC